jgi:ribulose-5-phosphate 4-epimerase/fuculose-1-phosphate aldolase
MAAAVHLQNRVSDREWQDRLHVAALCRLMALHRMGDATNQVVAIRSSEDPRHLITHRLGAFFDEVRASDLIRCDFSGREVHSGQQLKFGEVGGLNGGSLNLCVPIFQTRPEINCLIHGHAKPVMVISTLKEGLQPVSQPALFIIPRMGYWPYIFNEDENFRSDFAKAFEGKQVLLARDHGFYAIGKDAGEAFFLTFYLAQACDAQAAAMACGQELVRISDEEVVATWHSMKNSSDYHYDGSIEWPGWLRMVERLAPDYRD